jgi:hypothetical protein
MLGSMYRWPLLVILLVAVAGAPACADRPVIVFQNYRDYAVQVHVDGDRLLILHPHTAEGLPYTVAAWTWPRHIEVRAYGGQEAILSIYASAGDLALQNWRVDIR